MNYTENLNLNKPEKAEQYNLDHWNDNMDTIDTAVQGEINTRTSQVQTLTQNLSDEVTARQNGVADAKNLANATGTLAVEKGGTGMTTVQTALENLCSSVAAPSTLETTDDMLFMRSTNVKKIDMDTVATKIFNLIYNRIQTTIPTGIIYPFCGEYGINYANVPAGFLACDGRAISRTTYANLFAVIGTKYGNGDEITTFNVPDLRETVMVGAGQSSRPVLDASDHAHDIYTLGQFKDDQVQDHTHRPWSNMNESGWSYQVAGTPGGPLVRANELNYNNAPGIGLAIDARIGSVTHGKQLGINFIIKY